MFETNGVSPARGQADKTWCVCCCLLKVVMVRLGCCTPLLYDYQLGNERRECCNQHRRSSAASCPVRQCPSYALMARLIGHTAGTIMELRQRVNRLPGAAL